VHVQDKDVEIISGEAVEEYLRAGKFRFEESARNPLLF
jgi:hypothetical protein